MSDAQHAEPTTNEPSEFSIRDPLPEGTTLLEASAGTGKTWAIAALVTRYLAEGLATIEDLLVVTFGRAASAELKDRVRERLVEAERTLDGSLRRDEATPSPTPDDELLALVLDADPDERRRRRDRLRVAAARFDEATVTTTHGFCHAVLRGLGTTGDVEPGATLVEDDADLVAEAVSDLYLRYAAGGRTLPFEPKEAREIGMRAVGDPAATLLPVDAAPDSAPDLRRRFAGAVRDEVGRRRRRLRTLSYDDLLQRLAEALEAPDAPARALMRDRWRIVLVDEFQDTDPVQWQILERAFVGHATVVLVGDPKQAIYGFRGGDVPTYLHAAARAGTRRTLVLNHRSDAPLVEAVDVLLRGTALGHEQIVVRAARSALDGARLVDPDRPHPFRLRAMLRHDAGVSPDALLGVAAARAAIARDVAADIARLLTGSATFDDGDGPRPVRPGDVAVLVERHAEAELVHAELTAAGVPAVRGGGADVLRSDAAEHWLTLLSALEAPHRAGLVRAVAISPFFGHRAEELDGVAGESLTDAVSTRLRDLADLHGSRGTAGLVEAVVADADVVARVLGHEGGRRLLTDLEHVGHVLQQAARAESLGGAGLLRWLLDRRADGARAAERARRLDTDAEAVQVVTTFVSKGLQYPVVHAPFLFNRYDAERDVLRLHTEGRRSLDVGRGGPSHEEHVRIAASERAGESLRLLYVALTRAQSGLVLHWAPTKDSANAGLHRVLFRPDPEGAHVPDRVGCPPDADVVARLRQWADRGGPQLEQMRTTPIQLAVPPAAPDVLRARSLTRDLDPTWRRTSYTALVRQDDETTVGSEPPGGWRDDEDPVGPGPVPAPVDPPVPSPWADLAGGAALGTLVHAVLEEIDAEQPDLPAQVRDRVVHHLQRRPLAVPVDALVEALLHSLQTPLGPLMDDLTLTDALRLRPLRELDFELPLAGGDRSGGGGPGDPGRAAGPGTLTDVADLMEAHLPADDPLRAFAPRLRLPTFGSRTLHGYLTGSIDVLLRDPAGRTVVCDHKTNRLEAPGQGLEAYAPSRLAEAMLATTYPLQALLYTVAQHRFLRWRMPDYDPDVHLHGVLYLFLRGMAGPDGPTEDGLPHGVFSWQPPSTLVLALSDLLDGRVVTRATRAGERR